MPCRDEGQSAYEYGRRVDELNRTVTLLCEAIARLRENRIPLSDTLNAWAVLHDAEDASRLERQRQHQKSERARLQRLIQEATKELDGLRAEEE